MLSEYFSFNGIFFNHFFHNVEISQVDVVMHVYLLPLSIIEDAANQYCELACFLNLIYEFESSIYFDKNFTYFMK